MLVILEGHENDQGRNMNGGAELLAVTLDACGFWCDDKKKESWGVSGLKCSTELKYKSASFRGLRTNIWYVNYIKQSTPERRFWAMCSHLGLNINSQGAIDTKCPLQSPHYASHLQKC